MLGLSLFWLCLSASAALLSAQLFVRAPERQGAFLVLAAYPVVALGLWVGIAWGLSFAGALGKLELLSSGAAALAFALGWTRARRASVERTPFDVLRGFCRKKAKLLLFAPLVPVFAFLSWKGYVMPTSNPDALFLHLPRAVEISRNAGFPLGRELGTSWGTYGSYPLNYEGILATVVSLTGRDTVTEWFTTWTLGLLCSLVVGLAGLAWEAVSLR